MITFMLNSLKHIAEQLCWLSVSVLALWQLQVLQLPDLAQSWGMCGGKTIPDPE